jgi:hypothetical protein
MFSLPLASPRFREDEELKSGDLLDNLEQRQLQLVSSLFSDTQIRENEERRI